MSIQQTTTTDIVTPTAIIARFLGENEDKLKRSLQQTTIASSKFLQVAMTAIRGNQKLEECTPRSILSALCQAAEVGLFPGSTLGHAYLVPYWSKELQAAECTYIMGYKGMLALCHRSASIKKVEAHTVHEGEFFSVAYGEEGKIVHEVELGGERTDENCRGAYAIAYLTNGATLHEIMSIEELERIRSMIKGGNRGPWKDHRLAMYRKTPLRRLATWLPLEPQDQEAIAADEARELDYNQEPREVEAEDVASEADELAAMMASAQETGEPKPLFPEHGGIAEQTELDILDWMASEHTDAAAVNTYITETWKALSTGQLTEEQGQELLQKLQASDFEPEPF